MKKQIAIVSASNYRWTMNVSSEEALQKSLEAISKAAETEDSVLLSTEDNNHIWIGPEALRNAIISVNDV